MGYYTSYSLSVGGEIVHGQLAEDSWHPDFQKWRDAVHKHAEGYNNVFCDECKWYDHERHMKELSKEYPENLFCLHGEGESGDDFWRKYFKNGKVQVCRGSVVYPDFDEREMK